jgi:sucrose 6(F)-phosphate phosphorylase
MVFVNNKKVQLIAYPDSLGGNLGTLKHFLQHDVAGLFEGVHILPPFPSSGDRGFAPIDYHQIEPGFGTWNDIQGISLNHHVTLDIMVNHLSRLSPMFLDYLQKGEASEFADFFLPPAKVWGNSPPSAEEEMKIVLRRKKHCSRYRLADGREQELWTTFGMTDPSEQVDLDVNSPAVRRYFEDLFAFFSSKGISSIRLDAVGYVVKKRNTSCFMVEPEISSFFEWIYRIAQKHGLSLLSEVHAGRETILSLAQRGYPGYDFQLPFAVLYCLIARDSSILNRILENCGDNLVTVLDCHDGIPVWPDMEGVITPEQAWLVVNACRQRGAGFTKTASEQHRSDASPDVHQICGTLYSLLGEDDDAFLAARAIQLFTPGIAQIYYAGLFAARNDEKQKCHENDERGLNRHNYTVEEIEDALNKPVVVRLMKLIRFCGSHPSFVGNFRTTNSGKDEVCLSWVSGSNESSLRITLEDMRTVICYTDSDMNMQQMSL